jgi:hypothetical protein
MSMHSVLSGGVYLRARLVRAVVVAGCLAAALQASEWSAREQLALASDARTQGRYQEAEGVLRAAIGSALGNPLERAAMMVNLADLLREEARWSEAAQILNCVADLKDLPRESRIGFLVERADLRREMHQWPESIADWNEIGQIAETEHSAQLEEIYTGGLGETWLAAGETARAEPLLRRSLDLLKKDPNTASTQIAMALALVSSVYAAENRLALARDAVEEAISRDESYFGREHPQVATLLELRASILSRHGETDAARDDLDRARSIMTTHFGAESTAVAGVDASLGDLEEQAHRPDAAAEAWRQAFEILQNTGADGLRLSKRLKGRYTAALKAAHRSDEAKTVLAFAN